jgi:predicted nucleotidyltransferase
VSLIATASEVLTLLRREGVQGCLVGGLAVSTRCDPRFTRDVDLALAVTDDSHAEGIVNLLTQQGFRIDAVVEQETKNRLAMTRLVSHDDTSIDLLIASSGIEAEVVADAEPLEVVKQIILPVARVGHLIALKLLSVAPGRETDYSDLRNLALVADEVEWQRAKSAVRLIVERGYSRNRDLESDLETLRLT